MITAAEALSISDDKPTEWAISEAAAAGFFLVRNIHVPWLSSWRDNRSIDSSDRLVSLSSMMSSLRTVAANNYRQTNTYEPIPSNSAAQPKSSPNPDTRCKRCKHIYTNKKCFKQHLELATGQKGQKWKENVQKYSERLGKRKAIAEASESEDEEYYRRQMEALLNEPSNEKISSG